MARIDPKDWLTSEKILLIRGWKMNGVSDTEVAKNIGISRSTLRLWQNKYPDLRDALKKGKQEANYAVEQRLFSKAMSGNTTAIIFWLKNNWRSKYFDSSKSPEEIEYVRKQLSIMEIDKQRKQKELDMLNGNVGGIEIKFVGLDDDQTDNT